MGMSARLVGRGKNQKLVVETDGEPGTGTLTRDDNEEVLIEFKPKGKKDGTPQKDKTGTKERNTFFDEEDESGAGTDAH